MTKNKILPVQAAIDLLQYDPDFDDVDWGKPVPFKKIKDSLHSETAV